MATPKFSFSFSKQKRNPLLSSTHGQVEPHSERTVLREYVSSIENNVIKSEHVSKVSPIVVPLINNRRGVQSRLRLKYAKVEPSDELTKQALLELQSEARGENTHESTTTSFMVPLAGVSTVSEELGSVNYDAVPVEKFGLAALTGMGFNPQDLKSLTSEPTLPTRPKGLGLGANPHAVMAAKRESKPDSGEQLSWKPGARCQAILGKHKGQYGVVNGIDGDTGRVVVKFALSKEVVPVLQAMLRLVPEKEYNQYANCLNQAEVDRYKSEEADSLLSPTTQPTSQNAATDGVRSRSREPSLSLSSSFKRKDHRLWVRPNLIVKFLDKHYLSGKYYKHKVKIIEVNSRRCTFQTEQGQIIKDINPRYFQTVVPKTKNAEVMILHGPREGEMARIIHQNANKDEVDLRTRAGTMIRLSYDHVCMVADSF